MSKSKFDVSDAKVMYADIQRLLGSAGPPARFTQSFKKFTLKNNVNIVFSFQNGIVTIDNDGDTDIPKFPQLLAYMKTKFGNVYSTKQIYINARDFGGTHTEKFTVEIPTRTLPVKIPTSSQVMKVKTKDDARKMLLDPMRAVLDSRLVHIKGNVFNFKPTVIKKFDMFHRLEKHENHIFMTDGFKHYVVKDEAEGTLLVKLSRLLSKTLRELEVSSWNMSSMGPENMFDHVVSECSGDDTDSSVKLKDIMSDSVELSSMVKAGTENMVEKVSTGIHTMVYKGTRYTLVYIDPDIKSRYAKHRFMIYSGTDTHGTPVGNIFSTDKPTGKYLDRTGNRWVPTSVKLDGVKKATAGTKPYEVQSYTEFDRFKSFWDAIDITLSKN